MPEVFQPFEMIKSDIAIEVIIDYKQVMYMRMYNWLQTEWLFGNIVICEINVI